MNWNTAARKGALIGAFCALLATSAPGTAQDAATVSQGTSFANSLAPTSPGQVVNPSAVNPAAWSGSTSTPSAVPANLGGFSNPTTSNSLYTSAQGSSLSALGQQAVVNCANYAPGPNASPAQTQACAAVNFLTNQCMTPTTQQAAILMKIGASQTARPNCAGTYGAGVAQFNLQNQVTSADPVLTVMNNLNSTAAATAGSTCATQTVVTTPAQYSTNECVKATNASAEACSQYLNVTVSTTATPAQATQTCPTGVLAGNYCQASSSGAANITYVCPVGYTLSGSTCSETVTATATPVYSCPAGSTLSGTNCISSTNTSTPATLSYSCPSGETLSGTTCSGTLTQPATVANYSCPAGQTLSGTTCVDTSTTTGDATSSLACPAGSTLSGSNCLSTETASATPTYSCPSGYTLSGSTCTLTSSSAATIVDNCHRSQRERRMDQWHDHEQLDAGDFSAKRHRRDAAHVLLPVRLLGRSATPNAHANGVVRSPDVRAVRRTGDLHLPRRNHAGRHIVHLGDDDDRHDYRLLLSDGRSHRQQLRRDEHHLGDHHVQLSSGRVAERRHVHRDRHDDDPGHPGVQLHCWLHALRIHLHRGGIQRGHAELHLPGRRHAVGNQLHRVERHVDAGHDRLVQLSDGTDLVGDQLHAAAEHRRHGDIQLPDGRHAVGHELHHDHDHAGNGRVLLR